MSAPDAEALFAAFLAEDQEARSQDSSGSGDPEARLDVLCKAHPAQADALRRLHADWKRVEGVFDRLGANRTLGSAPKLPWGDLDPGISLDGDDPSAEVPERVQRLERLRPKDPRYLPRGEVGRGGMGAVLRIWDDDFRRSLAMKVVLGRKEFLGSGESAQVEPKKLRRFLEEAQITGQLDHPGIVPVHDLGVDEHGRTFFTMRLVRGQSFLEIIEEVHGETLADVDATSAKAPERPGSSVRNWTLPRALDAVLDVCQAVAFAHAKGVLHRDLKPSNVMVGRFGETYVMDWGLAKVMGREEHRDLRIRSSNDSAPSLVQTDRVDETETRVDAPLVTMDGDVVGTPAYMPPEQANGKMDEIGPHSDVYSVGAILYHLLSGQRPYVRPGERVSPYTLLNAVRNGPPEALETVRADLPGELVAICERAMAREPDARYATMLEMAEDLRAFREGRVVRAFATGAIEEFKKWVQRNRALAATAAAALVATVGGLGAVGWIEHRARGIAEDAERKTQEAYDAVIPYVDVLEVERLVEDIALLQPAFPDKVEGYRHWLERSTALEGKLEGVRSALADLRGRALPRTPAQIERDRIAKAGELEELTRLQGERGTFRALLQSRENPEWRAGLAVLEPRIAELEAAASEPLSWRFETREEAGQHDVFARFVEGLETMIDARDAMEERLEVALELPFRTLEDPEIAKLWQEAREDLGSTTLQGGRRLEPILGLRPLWKDPDSQHWEFLWEVSGDPPALGNDGLPVIDESTGIVLVLLPGGPSLLGSHAPDAEQPDAEHPEGSPHVDPGQLEGSGEGPPLDVVLAPFFCSKYEVTQAQWERVMAATPSSQPHGTPTVDHFNTIQPWNPVETVDWISAYEFCTRSGLHLPTEAQWEYACRAGSSTPFSTGSEVDSLLGSANISDEHQRAMDPAIQQKVAAEKYQKDFNDGHAFHAPIGSFEPNAFGLHDMHGNVSEWCLDNHSVQPGLETRMDDGLRVLEPNSLYVIKGGSYWYPASHARTTWRAGVEPNVGYHFIGLRPILPMP